MLGAGVVALGVASLSALGVEFITVVVSGAARLLPSAVAARATAAAWEAIKAAQAKTPNQQAGAAGEAASRVIARWVLEQTSAQSRVLDLNDILPNFIGVDSGSSTGFYQVKTFDVLAKQPTTKALDRYVRAYLKNFYDDKYVAKIAGKLDQHRLTIQQKGGWPADLPSNARLDAIADYLRDHGKMAVPDDHVIRVRARLGETLWQKVPANPELKGDIEQARIIQKTIMERVTSSGVKSTDLRFMIWAALKSQVLRTMTR